MVQYGPSFHPYQSVVTFFNNTSVQAQHQKKILPLLRLTFSSLVEEKKCYAVVVFALLKPVRTHLHLPRLQEAKEN